MGSEFNDRQLSMQNGREQRPPDTMLSA